jgi:hypothetical protein
VLRLRRDFPNPVKREMADRSGGICECHRVPQLPTYKVGGCGSLLGPGNTFYEHVIPHEIGGPSTADNGAVLVKTCWRLKTDVYDLPIIADAKRQQDRDRGIGGDGQGRYPMRGGRNSSETIGFDRVPRQRLNLTQKLLAAGIIDADALAAAREE